MMYSIYADETLIYSPSVTQFSLYDIVLNMEDNSAGTLQFNMTSAHPSFSMLKKLATLITVKNGDVVLWKGRIISDDQDINNIKKIQCEGKLAFLNDSIFPAFDFSGSPEKLFQDIIQNHNDQVSSRQRFLIGNVTVKDNNDYIVRSSINDARTWAALKDKCFQSSLGGHLQIRYEADGDYIDWLEDYTEVSGQPITFGKNIIDLLVNTSATETFTAIRPKGALADENGTERINIKSVNDGKDHIVDEEKAAEYGVIFASPDESIWEDITLPENLLQKAWAKLKAGTSLKKTIDVRAVDLNLTDAEIEALKVCTYVQVVSPLHGIAEYYLLSRAEIHMDAPEHTQYTLGAVKATFTDTSKTQFANVVQTVGAAIPSAVSQLKNDEGFVTESKIVEVIGKTAVSPTIDVLEQSEGAYKLQITSVSGTIETPNLMGPSGAPGEDGKDGVDGKDGADGQDGVQGESAYEAAVRHGFSGSEEEWLESLRGEKGQDGVDGQDGADGRDGADGHDGASGESAYEAAVRHGFSGSEVEWLESLHGEKGDQGEPGKPGSAGDYDILDTSDEVKGNNISGKLVDALVVKEVFQSVSEGKAVLASAITDKGVQTDASATFRGMAENISLIQGGGGAGGGAVLKGIDSISMPVPEGRPQITNVMNGLNAGVTAVVKSCEKVKITVKEG